MGEGGGGSVVVSYFCSDSDLRPSVVPQEPEVGTNPVQVEVGEFDEAIDVVEDVAAESEFTGSSRNQTFKINLK